MSADRTPHVVVIGGGIAGLAAAHRVTELSRERQRPLRVSLVEAKPRLGGSIGTEQGRERERADKVSAQRTYDERKERQREIDRLESRVRKIQERITALEERQKELKLLLEDLYTRGDRFSEAAEAAKAFESVRTELSALYTEWENTVPRTGSD